MKRAAFSGSPLHSALSCYLSFVFIDGNHICKPAFAVQAIPESTTCFGTTIAKTMIGQVRRVVLIATGCISFLLGVAGIFLPLLPTAPFMILSAYCWAKSSRRFHDALMAHATFGPMIRQWQEKGTMPRRTKYVALTMMTVSIVCVCFIFAVPPVGKWSAMVVMVPMMIWVATRPVSKNSDE